MILNMSTDTLRLLGRVREVEVLPFSAFNYLNGDEREFIKLYNKEGCLAYKVSTINYVIVE